MSGMKISVNREAYKIVRELMDRAEFYRVSVEELPCGVKVIDTGLEVQGGVQAGLKLTEICLGGLANVNLSYVTYSPDFSLPSIVVSTDYPALSLIGCQLAGWMVKVGDFFAPSSGPARMLAGKPKKVFEKLGYRDEADQAILVMEASRKPSNEVGREVAKACSVEPSNLYLILTRTSSMAGSVQVSGRVVETGLYRLEYLGLDPAKVIYAYGSAPIMPPHPNLDIATAVEEDALLYGGSAYYVVDEEEGKLKEIISKAPATSWPEYGKSSYETLKTVNFDWSKLDPSFFTIGRIDLTCKKTGRSFGGGKMNVEMLKKALTLQP